MMMRIYNRADLDEAALARLTARPRLSTAAAEAAVRPVLDDVRTNGDEAVIRWNQKFGAAARGALYTPLDQLPDPELEPGIREAIDRAIANIEAFHRPQIRPRMTVETMPGVTCYREFRPVERAGLYVPGGTAVLPSTAMMLCVPAKLAGCSTIVLATPPDEQGRLLPEIVYIAKRCGVTGILAAGGAQAIAAMAYGTATVPKTDKLFGPGNQYVTAAKSLLAQSDAMVAIDMPAGPSEVLVVADETADPGFVAADLLSQAEHGADSQVVLVLTGKAQAQPVLAALQEQLKQLPRAAFAEKALSNGFILHTRTTAEAIAFSNRYAPEHLILQTAGAGALADAVINAGSVFIGPWTPESAGDYASGTNHTLPTYGYARQYGGVSTESFGRYVTFQNLTADGLRALGPTVETLAGLEGLEAHRRAVSIRLEKLNA